MNKPTSKLRKKSGLRGRHYKKIVELGNIINGPFVFFVPKKNVDF